MSKMSILTHLAVPKVKMNIIIRFYVLENPPKPKISAVPALLAFSTFLKFLLNFLGVI